MKKFVLCFLVLLSYSPAMAQKLPHWLEKQVHSGSLSQQEAVLLWKGSSKTPQPSVSIQEAKANPRNAPQETPYVSNKVANIISPGCADLIVSDIRARFSYKTIEDGPRWGMKQSEQTLSIMEGNLQNLRGGDSDSFSGRFLTAIKESAPFTRPQCGHPSGTLTVSAKNSQNSIGQWSLDIELQSSTLR